MPRWHNTLLIFLALFAMSSLALAQRDLGTITGTITDASGAAVPNAKITITETATGVSYETVSNATGTYTRPALTPVRTQSLLRQRAFRNLNKAASSSLRANHWHELGLEGW